MGYVPFRLRVIYRDPSLYSPLAFNNFMVWAQINCRRFSIFSLEVEEILDQQHSDLLRSFGLGHREVASKPVLEHVRSTSNLVVRMKFI